MAKKPQHQNHPPVVSNTTIQPTRGEDGKLAAIVITDHVADPVVAVASMPRTPRQQAKFDAECSGGKARVIAAEAQLANRPKPALKPAEVAAQGTSTAVFRPNVTRVDRPSTEIGKVLTSQQAENRAPIEAVLDGHEGGRMTRDAVVDEGDDAAA